MCVQHVVSEQSVISGPVGWQVGRAYQSVISGPVGWQVGRAHQSVISGRASGMAGGEGPPVSDQWAGQWGGM